ncbi:X-ray repair cross-complementing protein 5-like [Oppia nitens]|uniref:X-ray repair cross-complementing protein 5-like n=1 Tax=Oppia nitens TaxID=1686743 RepID=UPI0023DB5012|nr:X-ray repair cross-complementing protein 5-like [Oppia nitens]
MSRNAKEAIVLAIDCWRAMSAESTDGTDDADAADDGNSGRQTQYQLSVECLENIIRQKIFAESKNEYQLIEFSTAAAAAGNGYRLFNSLSQPDFTLLTHICGPLRDHNSSASPSNVMDVLGLAIRQLVETEKKFTEKKIALLTNFSTFTDEDYKRFVHQIGYQLKRFDIQLIVICDFIPSSSTVPPKQLSKCQLKALKLMEYIEEQDIGYYYQLRKAVHQFSHFVGKKTTPAAWYSTLELGKGLNALNIPIGALMKAQQFKKKTGIVIFKPPQQQETLPAAIESGATTSAIISSSMDTNDTVDVKPSLATIDGQIQLIVDNQNNSTGDQAVESGTIYQSAIDGTIKNIEKEEVIYAHKYGQTLVPFSDDDKKSFDYTNNQKGMRILGFASVNDIDITYRMGQKSWYLFADPRPKKHNHRLVFQTLVAALLDMQSVAIVRYNWSDRSSPQMGYLMPLIESNNEGNGDDDNMFLVFTQLPFDEDVRHYSFPSLYSKPRFSPTDDQLAAVDGLIDSMDLMTAGIDEDDGNPSEALLTESIYNPQNQYWFQCLYHRQLYGTTKSTEMPQMSDSLRNCIEIPRKNRQKSIENLVNISQKFPLNSIKSANKQKLDSISSQQSIDDLQPDIKRVKISTDEDNKIAANIMSNIDGMIDNREPFENVSKKLDNQLNELFADRNTVDANCEQIVDLLDFYRKLSLMYSQSKSFNQLMLTSVKSFRGTDFWYYLLAKELTLISMNDCSDSDISQEMADNYTNLSADDNEDNKPIVVKQEPQ